MMLSSYIFQIEQLESKFYAYESKMLLYNHEIERQQITGIDLHIQDR